MDRAADERGAWGMAGTLHPAVGGAHGIWVLSSRQSSENGCEGLVSVIYADARITGAA